MRSLRFLPPMLLLLQLFLPACELLGIALGLEFYLYHTLLYAVVSTVLMLAATVALCIWELPRSRFRRVVCLLLLPAALINGLFWLGSRSDLAVIMALVNSVCAGVLLFRRGGKGNVVVFMLCIPLAMFVVWMGFWVYLIGGLSENTVVRELDSPDGSYTAQIIGSDQGGLGGNTFVEIRDHSSDLDLLIGQFRRPSERIYSGEWGEYEDMRIVWLDEQTLQINGERYSIEE